MANVYSYDVQVGQNWDCYIVAFKKNTKEKKLQTLHKKV